MSAEVIHVEVVNVEVILIVELLIVKLPNVGVFKITQFQIVSQEHLVIVIFLRRSQFNNSLSDERQHCDGQCSQLDLNVLEKN